MVRTGRLVAAAVFGVLLVGGCDWHPLAGELRSGPPVRLSFVLEPASAPAGDTIGPVDIDILDANDNCARTYFTVTVAIAPGTGAAGAVLGGNTQRYMDGDCGAAFDDLTIDRPGEGYRLTVSAGNLPPVTSKAFDITSP